ncbi:MAG: lamin tail domain-containing protein, partial [Verrucomicrobia bacterium]|nr:lamin tail domain-containing protein [Verrucomicrobiota bacterium]
MKKIFAELALLIGTVLTVSAGDIVINEIMYHPQSENIREQWIELYNTTGSAIDLSGWAFTKGISYTFAEGTMIEADGYLVITADVEAFAMVYPNVTNVIGNWEGKLSNRGENIRLTKANGKTETEVHYAPEGDWAQRRLIQEQSYGCWGWDWYAEHQGAGKSVELVNPALPISIGQNWNSSQTDGGTPGAVNSWHDSIPKQAPLLSNVTHSPALPRSTEAVTISVQVHTSGEEAFQVFTHWKTTEMNEFLGTEMLDNGDFQGNGDILAYDGYFSAKLPEQPVGTIVEFYLTATTESGLTRVYPNVEEAESRTPWLLYQVDEEGYASDQPMLRIIMDPLEYNYLKTKIWGEQGLSEALVNGTVICQTPSQPMPEIFYQA